MGPEIIIPSEVKAEGERQIPYDIFCGLELMTQMNLSMKQTHRQRVQTWRLPREREGGMEWDCGVGRYRLDYYI